MREIKFRGRRVDNGEWVCGYLFSYGINSFIVGEKDFICYENNSTAPTICELRTFGNRVIPETVGQYTGLKDKNGKEIYEGDILTTENGTFLNTGQGYVRIYKGGFVSFYGQDTFNRDCFDELYNVCDEREIIGNIYENPELLEVNNE